MYISFVYFKWIKRMILWASFIGLLWIGYSLVPLFLNQSFHVKAPPGLIKPSFYGKNKGSNGYHLWANYGLRLNNNNYFFQQPCASFEKKATSHHGGYQCFIYAKRGVFSPQEKVLNLHQFFEVHYQGHNQSLQKYYFQTDRAALDLRKKNITGKKIVRGRGPLGHFYAEGFTVDKQKLYLSGPVHMVITKASFMP